MFDAEEGQSCDSGAAAATTMSQVRTPAKAAGEECSTCVTRRPAAQKRAKMKK